MRPFVVSLLAAAASGAQVDLAKRLVGKWEGEIQVSRGGNRTLVIESVTQNGGKWMAEGRYGISGKALLQVQIEVDEDGGKPWIRFVTGANSTVRLGLFQDKYLVGTFTPPGGTAPISFKLEREE